MTALRVGSATDVGRRREKNDDTPLTDERLFAVADGMGGYTGGDVASSTAIDALRRAFAARPDADGLEQGVLEAGRAVQERSRTHPDLRQMGTTLSAVALVDTEEGEVFALAHIGDSRIYLWRDNELSQLTDDHTVPEDLKRAGQLSEAEAAVDPRRHIITRVLGASGEYTPDLQTLVPYRGDRLLLCSDGLTDEVTDEQIAHTLRTVPDAQTAADRLVGLANERGGRDNITVVIVDVVDDDDKASAASAALAAAGELRTSTPAANAAAPRRGLMTAEERNAQLRELAREDDSARAPWDPAGTGTFDSTDLPARRFTLRVALFVLVLLVVLGGAVGAVWWYATNSYFVGSDEGQVAIFKGRPGGLLVFQPKVEEPTDLTVAQLPPARVDDVTAGHEAGSLDAARRFVRNLRREAELVSPGTTAAPGTATTAPSTPSTTAAPATTVAP